MSQFLINALIKKVGEVEDKGKEGLFKVLKIEVVEMDMTGKENHYELQAFNDNALQYVELLKPEMRATFSCYLQGRKWTSQDGKERIFMNIVVADVQNLVSATKSEHQYGSQSIKAKDVPNPPGLFDDKGGEETAGPAPIGDDDDLPF